MKNILGKYEKEDLASYEEELTTIARLSNLFAAPGSAPMIYYRAVENIYSRAFHAKNTSRDDNTADAILLKLKAGVGIKTFIYKEKGSYEKVAEFDKQVSEYKELTGRSLAEKIAELRNARIETTKRNYGLKSMFYHCVLRSKSNEIRVFEIPMHEIDVNSIKSVADNGKTLEFKDKHGKYKFYRSKSTLMMHFLSKDEMLKFKVKVIKDPMEALVKALQTLKDSSVAQEKEVLFIPLYKTKKDVCFLETKSGLNAWNASAAKRKRKPDEIYIPYPQSLKKEKPHFFPGKDEKWYMELPDGKKLKMKICQGKGKAIMSNPNTDLGKWLLRDVLKIEPGEVVTYEHLLNAGITSIKITKESEKLYSCDFVENDEE